MWQAIAFVVAEILKMLLGKLMEPPKAVDARGTIRVPVAGDELVRKLEGTLRRSSTPNLTGPRYPSIG
jgi:hypothetical protein